MLEDLIKGREKSKCVLITDTSQNNGRHLILNWTEELLSRCEKLILVCFDRPPEFFRDWVQPSLRHKLICIDGDEDEGEDGEPIYSLDRALESVKETVGCSTAVIIDSLSMPILMRPATITCTHLHQIQSEEHVVQVAAIVHRDLTDDHDCGMLEHISSSVIDILPSCLASNQVCHIRHCRPTGKVFKTKESFEFNDNFHLQRIGPLKTTQETQQAPVHIPQEPDPVSSLDLSFKLGLTDKEKEARSQVVLPYLKDSLAESTSKIIYEADDADDFDEEDPDDDLNI